MKKEKPFSMDLSKNEPCEIGYTLRSWEGGTNLVPSIFKEYKVSKDDMVYVIGGGYGYVIEFKDDTFDMTAVSDKIWDNDKYYHATQEWRVRFYRIKIGDNKYATARSDSVKVDLKCLLYNKFLKPKSINHKYVPNDCPFCGKDMNNRECDCPRTQAMIKYQAEMWHLKDSTDRWLKILENRRQFDVDRCEKLFSEDIKHIKGFGSYEEYEKEYDKIKKEYDENMKKAEITEETYTEIEEYFRKEQAEISARYIATLKKLKEEADAKTQADKDNISFYE